MYPETSSPILSVIESVSSLRLMVTGSSVVLLKFIANALLIVISLDAEDRSSPLIENIALDGYCDTLSKPNALMKLVLFFIVGSSKPSTKSGLLVWISLLGLMLNIVGLIPLIPVMSETIERAVLPRLSSLTLAANPMFDRLMSLASLFCMSELLSSSSTVNWNS